MYEPPLHDEHLFEILKECKTLPNFLDAVFGFLKRRTDFYYIATEPNSQVGLPEGIAEKCVKQIFYKWKLCDELLKPEINEQSTINNFTDNSSEDCMVPPAICEVVLDGDDDESSIVVTSTNKPVAHFTTADSYNGAIYDNYRWSQTITDVDVHVEVPDNITSKHLKVQIESKRIKVETSGKNILLEGELCEKVKHHEALWSLDKQILTIHLDKVTEFWWNCLVTHEPKIDVGCIDCSRPYDELSADSQAKIEELSWNEERKRLGLPTSEEIILENKLRKACITEGSPFTVPNPNTMVVFDNSKS